MKNKKTIFAAMLITISLTSCKKESINSGGNYTPQVKATTFYADNFVDSSGVTNNSIGMYYTSPMENTTTVEVNDINLSYVSNQYTYTQLTPVGSSNWIIDKYKFSGGFSYTPNKSIPYINPIKFSIIDLTKDYTYKNSISADTIIYSIYNGTAFISKKAYLNSESITFTKQELNTIFNTSSTIAKMYVKAINISTYTPLSTKYYFVMQNTFYNGNVSVTH